MTTLTWLLAILSLVGTFLNVRQDSRGFYLWSVANTGWVFINFQIGQYAQSALFAVYLVLAIWAIWSWRKKEEKADITSTLQAEIDSLKAQLETALNVGRNYEDCKNCPDFELHAECINTHYVGCLGQGIPSCSLCKATTDQGCNCPEDTEIVWLKPSAWKQEEDSHAMD